MRYVHRTLQSSVSLRNRSIARKHLSHVCDMEADIIRSLRVFLCTRFPKRALPLFPILHDSHNGHCPFFRVIPLFPFLFKFSIISSSLLYSQYCTYLSHTECLSSVNSLFAPPLILNTRCHLWCLAEKHIYHS